MLIPLGIPITRSKVLGSKYSLQSLVFDGVDEYCTISATAYSGDFTLSMWIKPTLSTNNVLFGDTGNSEWTRLTTLSSVTLKWNNATSNVALSPSFIIDEWDMITITRIGSAVKIYKGDTEAGSVTKSDTFTPNTIGGKNVSGGSARFMTGNIDEATAWSEGLSAADVTELYNNGKPINPSTHSAVADLTNHWRMGEGDTISSITDLVGSNDATPVNMEAADIVNDTP